MDAYPRGRHVFVSPTLVRSCHVVFAFPDCHSRHCLAFLLVFCVGVFSSLHSLGVSWFSGLGSASGVWLAVLLGVCGVSKLMMVGDDITRKKRLLGRGEEKATQRWVGGLGRSGVWREAIHRFRRSTSRF